MHPLRPFSTTSNCSTPRHSGSLPPGASIIFPFLPLPSWVAQIQSVSAVWPGAGAVSPSIPFGLLPHGASIILPPFSSPPIGGFWTPPASASFSSASSHGFPPRSLPPSGLGVTDNTRTFLWEPGIGPGSFIYSTSLYDTVKKVRVCAAHSLQLSRCKECAAVSKKPMCSELETI